MFPLLQRTLQIYSKQGRPLHVGMSLSLPQSFTLQRDRECIVPRQFAREVVFDEFPAASRCASLRAATSHRSPTSQRVTHFAPGDRYYILYHSPRTLSWDICARTHTRASLCCMRGREEAEGAAEHKNRPRPDHNTTPSLFLPHPSPSRLDNIDIP